MRKVYIAFLITVTVLCIMIGSYNNLVRRDTANYEEEYYGVPPAEEFEAEEDHTYRFQEDITGLDIDIEAGNVYIWNGPEIAIDVNDPEFVTFEVDQNVLKIKQNPDYKTHWNRDDDGSIVHDNLQDLMIWVPDTLELKSLDVEIEAGTFSMSNYKIKQAEIECDLGDIQMDNVDFEKAEITAKMGNISLNGVGFHELKVEEDMGNIDLYSYADLSNYEKDLSVKLGNLYMNGASIGRSIQTPGTEGKLTVVNKMGDVQVNWENI